MLLFPYTGILVPNHTPWSILLVRLLKCLYNHTQTLTSLLHLSWFMHISITIKKAKRLLDLIYRNFYSNSSPSTLLSLYKSMVRPVLECGSAVWDPASPSASSTLKSVQLFALKIISKSWSSPYSSLLSSTKIQTPAQRGKIVSRSRTLIRFQPAGLRKRVWLHETRGKKQKLIIFFKITQNFSHFTSSPLKSVPMLDPFQTSPHITSSFFSVIHPLIY